MGGIGDSKIGFGGFLLGIQKVILSRSRSYTDDFKKLCGFREGGK